MTYQGCFILSQNWLRERERGGGGIFFLEGIGLKRKNFLKTRQIGFVSNFEMEWTTQAKALLTSLYGLIRFTLEPRNFTLNIFQDFVLTYLKQNDRIYKTIDFSNFSWK